MCMLACISGWMQIMWLHKAMMGWWVVFCIVISHVFSSWLPVDEKLALLDSVSDPVESHVHGSRSALFDGVVGYAGSSGVVSFDWCWWLLMTQFCECCA